MPPREIKGAVHVHSDFSDGSGSVEQIIEAARSAQLDFLILTDHDNTDAALHGYGGRYGGLLLLVGAEISPPRSGHCLVLGGGDVTGLRWVPERYYLPKLRRDRADVYIAHPEGRVKQAFGLNLRRWRIWDSEHFDGLEIWSYMHDWIENLHPLNLPYYYLRPDRAIDGPDPKVLRIWDRLNLHRPVSGLGALDAHAVKRVFGAFTAFKYEQLFRTILTHAWVDEWGADPSKDALSLRDSLKRGRSFIAYDALAPAAGFTFELDNVPLRSGPAVGAPPLLRARVPREAEISLIHNGRPLAAASGLCAEFPAGSPGVYRVEVRLDRRPWIFSNHLRLK